MTTLQEQIEAAKAACNTFYSHIAGCEVDVWDGCLPDEQNAWHAVVTCIDACTMCVGTKRGPARIASDTIGDISAQYLKLEDGSGIGMNEADLYLRGFRAGMERAAGIAFRAVDGLIDTPDREPYVMTVYEAICENLAESV